MSAGFSVVPRNGSVELTIWSERSPLLSWHRSDNDAAVMLGRLHYRSELLNALSHRSRDEEPQQSKCTNAELALDVYRCLGLSGLERMEGAFSVVIWDGQRGRLVGARDPLGGYPLFWCNVDDGIAFATRLPTLLDLLSHRTLNLEYLADFVMVPGPVNERVGEDCVYEGIHRVPPGAIVSQVVPAGLLERRTYWHWPEEHFVDPGTDRLDEIGSQYATVLRAAVRERLHGRIAAHVSGGMDSSAVAIMARECIEAGVAEAPLHTLSLVYERLPGLARERRYIDVVLAQEPNVLAHRIPADDLLDFDSFSDPPPHDEPYVGLWRMGMDRALVQQTASVGASVMLTGIGADEMLDVQPFHLADLLRHGRLRSSCMDRGL